MRSSLAAPATCTLAALASLAGLASRSLAIAQIEFARLATVARTIARLATASISIPALALAPIAIPARISIPALAIARSAIPALAIAWIAMTSLSIPAVAIAQPATSSVPQLPSAAITSLGPSRGFASGGHDRFLSAALDAHGRLVAAGFTTDATGAERALLARYRADGALDESFGAGGVVIARFGAKDRFSAIALDDTHGSIFAAGKSSFAPKKWKTLIARFDSGGALQESFGPNAPPFSGYTFASAHPDEHFTALALTTDHRVCAAGAASELSLAWFRGPWLTRPWFYRTLVACFTEDLAPDLRFGARARGFVLGRDVEPWWTAPHDELTGMRALANGDLITVGWAAGDLAYHTERTIFARWNRDGTLDAPPSMLGPERSRAGGTKEVFYDVAVTRADRVLPIGFSFDGASHVRAIAGNTVEETGALAGGEAEYAVAGTIDARGRLIIAGFTSTLAAEREHVDRAFLARYGEDGRRDPSFAGTYTSTSAGEAFFDVVAAPHDQVWAVGTSAGRALVARW